MREQIAELGLWTVLAVALGTELLSLFHGLSFWPVSLLWVAIAWLWFWRLRGLPWSITWDWLVAGLLAAIIGILGLEATAAGISAPNSSDAMAYHMPRVVYWMQQRSVEFFATPYLNQIMLQPLDEYLILHFQILSGGDRLANFVAWISTAGYILVVSLIAGRLGAGPRGQALSAFLAATLPNGIMQASGAKNESLLAFLLASLVWHSLTGRRWAAAFSLALACFTKGTGYLYAAPLLLLLAPRAIPHAALALLLVNGAFFWRNVDLSGSPLGFDSAHADGRYRWRNEYLSWQPLVSNLLRATSEQMGARSERWNEAVHGVVLASHRALGLNPQDPATTWPYTEYLKPRSANHEADSNNRWHLLLLLLATGYWDYRREWIPLRIVGALLLGLLLFCFYLKWQPFLSRMYLPLFVVAMSVAGCALGRAPVLAQIAVCLYLLDGARLPLLKNWLRPLRGPDNLFTLTREDTYYQDMRPWNVRKQYDELLAQLRQSDCRTIAFDITWFQLEYPIQALLLKAHPDTRFLHVNTQNPSKKYTRQWQDLQPCALVCLACDRWLEIPPPKDLKR